MAMVTLPLNFKALNVSIPKTAKDMDSKFDMHVYINSANIKVLRRRKNGQSHVTFICFIFFITLDESR